MGCCKKFLFILAFVIALLMVLPPPRDFPVNSSQIIPVTYLEDLGVPLNQLDKAQMLELPQIGAQDIEIDSKGVVYTGSMFGVISKINTQTKKVEELYNINGRILGLSLSPSEQYLAVAHNTEGLVLCDLRNGTWKSLLKGSHLISLNAITFVSEDLLYFTVSGLIDMDHFHEELLYRTTQGKIYSYNILTGQAKIQVENLYFPNGIIYSKKDHCLYVNELNNHRVLKFSLDPENYLKSQTVFESHSVYIDNIKITEDGLLWIGTPSLRDHVTYTIDRFALIRKILLNIRIPNWLFLGVADMKYVGGIKIDPHSHEIVQYLFGKSDKLTFTTCVNERNGKIIVGTRISKFIAVTTPTKMPKPATQSHRAQEL